VLLVRTFDLDPASCDAGQAVARVLAATDANVPVWTFLEGKGSEVAAALEKFPALDALGPPVRGALRPRLASLPDREVAEPFRVPIERDLARVLAAEIPRRLAFEHDQFVFGPIDSLWLANAPLPALRIMSRHPKAAELLACIVVRSSWRGSKRKLEFEVHVATSTPSRDATALPPLPSGTTRLLAKLPSVRREHQQLIAEPNESAAMQSALANGDSFVKTVALRTSELPHPDLQDDASPTSGESFGSFKDQLRALLPAYRYHSTSSRRGIWVLSRHTDAQNEIVLTVDRGSTLGRAFAELSIGGPLWSHGFRLPASRFADDLQVWRPETLAALCRNWTSTISTLEREVVPELEQVYGPGFAWYSRV
jgi:hypothetical protein